MQGEAEVQGVQIYQPMEIKELVAGACHPEDGWKFNILSSVFLQMDALGNACWAMADVLKPSITYADPK